METGLFSSKRNQVLGSIGLVMVIVALASYTVLNLKMVEQTEPMPATFSVTGKGEVMATPDIATFSFSVEAKAPTAAEAQAQSGTKVNALLSYLREQGVEDKDIKTQNYSLYPNYRYEEKVCAFGSFCPPSEPIPDGFTVSQTVVVKVRDTDKATALIAGVGEREATNISGLTFTIDDVEALKAKAREAAIEDAKAKADILAAKLGVKVVRLVSYYENEGFYPDPYFAKTEMAASADTGFGGAELPMGEESTSVEVQVTYEVK
jgi:uncharacterized protein YggE